MTTDLVLVVALAAFGASWALTALVRRFALARAMLDVPNQRSSHTVATPRGGGLAIVLVTLGGCALLGAAGWLDHRTALALVGGGAAIAAVGWLDDRRGVRAAIRALVHGAAALWALYWIGGYDAMRVGTTTLPLGVLGHLLAAVGIVWLVNLYNFMDGIDGIAGVEAVLVAGALGLVLVGGAAPGVGVASLLLAAATGGFLVWNWPPARIFMGDVGSGTIGFLLAVLAVASERAGGPTVVAWSVALGVFIVDATVTLIRRFLAGERLHVAHRSHAYQRLTQAGRSHAWVTLRVAVVTAGLCVVAALQHLRSTAEPLLAAGALVALLVLYASVERVRPFRARSPAGASAGGETPPSLN